MFAPTAIAASFGGIAGGIGAFHGSEGESPGDRARQAGAGVALGAGAAAGVYMGGRAVYKSGMAEYIARKGMRSANRYSQSLSHDLNRAASDVNSGASSRVRAAGRVIGKRPLSMMTAGAAVGALIGSRYDEPGKGAAVGAGLGLMGAGVSRFASSKAPGIIKGPVIAALAIASTIAAGTALRSTAYESEAETSQDGMGYGYAESGTSQRLRSMGATGDIALGLHNRRHG